MTTKEKIRYLNAIEKAEHLNVSARLVLNTFVLAVEWYEDGGDRDGLDEMLKRHDVRMLLRRKGP